MFWRQQTPYYGKVSVRGFFTNLSLAAQPAKFNVLGANTSTKRNLERFKSTEQSCGRSQWGRPPGGARFRLQSTS